MAREKWILMYKGMYDGYFYYNTPAERREFLQVYWEQKRELEEKVEALEKELKANNLREKTCKTGEKVI